MSLQQILKSHLEETGESMRSLSLRAGLNAKAVSSILNEPGYRPVWKSVQALSAATGIDLPAPMETPPETYAEVLARLDQNVSSRAVHHARRLRWFLRKMGWIAELRRVDRDEVIGVFEKTKPATFGLAPKSFATCKSDVLAAIDGARPRARGRSISDIGGIHAEAYAAIKSSTLPQDLKLNSGSFLLYLHDAQIAPDQISRATLEEYFQYRCAVSPKGEKVAKKHVKTIARLLGRLASDPAFARFGFTEPGHPFEDRRDRFGVPHEDVAAILAEFDTRIVPWVRGEVSRDGLTRAEFIAALDAETPGAEDEKRAKLRRSGVGKPKLTAGKAREADLRSRGFLLPRECWSEATIQSRRGFVAAAAKALIARADVTIETLEELTDPEIVEAFATALVEASSGDYHSDYAASVVKAIIKIAKDYLLRPQDDIIALQGLVSHLERGTGGMSERNLAKLRQFTPERLDAFISVSDALLRRVNSAIAAMRKSSKSRSGSEAGNALEGEVCRDVMCALAHEILIARAPRSANVFGIRLDWIRWSETRATIVVPAEKVKMRTSRDNDLQIDLSAEASDLLRKYLEGIRPQALLPGDADNPHLFPTQNLHQFEPGRPYLGLLNRLVRHVFDAVGIPVHPHLYRHLIGWIWLREDINALPTVQKLLGHRDIQTTITYYAAIDESLAMTKWQEHINARRKP